jgi:MFS family permease
MTAASRADGPWVPLHSRVFRWLWIASVVSNVGTIMHTVGAAWALTSLTTSPAIVSLAQTAWTVPGFLFALPAGAFADTVDRRRLILVATACAMLVAAALGVLQLTDHLGVALLLVGTFLLSVALTLSAPAFMALIPDLVPDRQLPQAIGLNAIAYNGSQSVGPALGGLLIALAGPGAVFLANAASFLGIVFVLRAYQPAREQEPVTERPVAAMRSGVDYFRQTPSLRRYALRIMLAFTVTSSLTALLPVLARRRLHTTAAEFGLLSAALGVGAVAAIWVMPFARRRCGPDGIVAGAGVVWAAGTAALALTHSLSVAAPALLLAGGAAMATMNTVYALFMAELPSWVRGRASSVVMLVVWLGASAGAYGWGALASSVGVPTALVASAAAQVAVSALAFVLLRLAPAAEAPRTPAPLTATFER